MTDYFTELFGDANPSMEEIEAGIAAMLAVEKARSPTEGRDGHQGICATLLTLLTLRRHRDADPVHAPPERRCFACGGSGNA